LGQHVRFFFSHAFAVAFLSFLRQIVLKAASDAGQLATGLLILARCWRFVRLTHSFIGEYKEVRENSRGSQQQVISTRKKGTRVRRNLSNSAASVSFAFFLNSVIAQSLTNSHTLSNYHSLKLSVCLRPFKLLTPASFSLLFIFLFFPPLSFSCIRFFLMKRWRTRSER